MKNRFAISALGLTLVVLCPFSVLSADTCRGTSLTTTLVTLNSSGVTGTATLCIYHKSVYSVVTAANLISGDAYTTWFVYFDNPANCLTPSHCTPDDTKLPADNPEGVLARQGSGIASRRAGLSFAGHVRGLALSHGSVVTIPIFAHGPAATDGRALARQVLTPQDPAFGSPGLGTTSDGVKGTPVAVAGFAIP